MRLRITFQMILRRKRVREGIEKEAQIQHNLSAAVFIEISDGDEREVLSKDEVNAATDQARRLQEAKGLSEEEYVAFIKGLLKLAVDEYEKNENESESESERAEEENGFLFFPNSVICLLLGGAIVHIFDNYPGDNDVLSISESEMRKRQQNGTLGFLEAYRSRTIFRLSHVERAGLFSNKMGAEN